MRAFRAVLLDFFGTLTRAVRRGPDHARIARLLGCEPDRFVAALDASFALRATGHFGSAAAALRHVCALAGARPGADRLRDALASRVAAIRRDTELRPESVPVLARLRALGMRTAVVSDCCYELPSILPTLPVAPLLDARVYSVREGVCKPEPAIYLAACARLGVAPAECLYVGDGGSRELTGAAALGMTAVRLAAPDLTGHLVFDRDDAWSGPAIGSLLDLPTLFEAVPAGGVPPMAAHRYTTVEYRQPLVG
ncbi:HAD family hydrolase [Rhizomonospora bruguierae]|uniref:HAD family hydrolase n=1 Tax=Rhizomonospora bruguierae TaxID=1581705 RepID=UPI001BCC545A|nr:HAD-IA family hydrolase [Micromonospora sp. NBRC 107566]